MPLVSSKSLVLILSIVMPGREPDIDHVQPVESFEECWAAAREFVERDLTEDLRSHGAVGLKATCGYFERPSHAD